MCKQQPMEYFYYSNGLNHRLCLSIGPLSSLKNIRSSTVSLKIFFFWDKTEIPVCDYFIREKWMIKKIIQKKKKKRFNTWWRESVCITPLIHMHLQNQEFCICVGWVPFIGGIVHFTRIPICFFFLSIFRVAQTWSLIYLTIL